MTRPDRRRRRSRDVVRALQYQLDACREEGQLQAIVVTDDSGVCLAAAGAPETCEEIAARVPMLGRKAGNFQGVLLSEQGGWPIAVRILIVEASQLYICAVGGGAAQVPSELHRSMDGVARILAAG